ncbi:wings apart-like protein homolog [Anneissia japonica]|uniref:wings apart-like protein homolog n=1 Tax=Anneissia japonica TaxID=1529436 RepID=UPI00142588E3|nr:wings apart-like protein homolog [Anneissia japonica]
MPRYGSKTYGKTRQTSSNTNFDEAYDGTRRPVTRSTPTKMVSGRSTRSSTTNRNGEALSPAKRRRGDMDPFSFSSDEDLSPRKRTPVKKDSERNVGASLKMESNSDAGNSVGEVSNKPRTNQELDTNVKRSRQASSSSNEGDFGPLPKKQESILKFTKRRVMNGPEEESDVVLKNDTTTETNKTEEIFDIKGINEESLEESKPEKKSKIEEEREMREQQDADFWNRILDLDTDEKSGKSKNKSDNKNATNNEVPKSKAWQVNDCQEPSTSSNVTQFLPPSPKKFDHTYSRDVKIKGQMSPTDHTYSKEKVKPSSSCGALVSSVEIDSSQSSKYTNAASQSSLSSQKSSEMQLSSSQSSNSVVDEFDFDADTGSSQESMNPAISKILSKGKKPGIKFFAPKSKKIFNNSPKKSPAKIRYNARSWQKDLSHNDDSGESASTADERTIQSRPSSSGQMKRPAAMSVRSTEKMNQAVGGITKQVIYPTRLNHSIVTSLKCHREEKELYTVVRNVKQAHQCQESGESQQFFDDIEYLLDGLSNLEPTPVRCLSIISLASKCSAPSFRVHLRAHGTISKLFRELYDAESDPSLAVSTAFLMYMLSRDRLNMDYNRQIIGLLMKLLTYAPVDMTSDTPVVQEFKKTLEKVKDILEKIPDTNAVKRDVEIGKISTNYLAMECLLSLTSRKATDWLKEELRKLGGLDFVVDTVFEQVSLLGGSTTFSDSQISSLKQIERCQRVLENSTFLNTVNQEYLINYNHCGLINDLAKALKVCEGYIEECSSEESILEIGQEDTKGFIVRKCLLSILRVLLNLTHDSEWGCIKVGGQEGMIKTILLCVMQIPQHIPADQRFDLLLLGLGLLINLMEHSPGNCKTLIKIETKFSYDSKPQEHSNFDLEGEASVLQALTQMFLQREKAAKLAETMPESPTAQSKQDGEWKESQDGMEWITIETEEGQELSADSQKEIKKTINKALKKAGKHMEDSIVASYCALLLGCLLRNNQSNVRNVRDILPNNDFACMVDMLKGFLEFMEMTNAVGSSGGKSISKIIEVFELL